MAVSLQEELSGHSALPDPGERVPALALPTVGVFLAALTVFAAMTVMALDHTVPRAVTIAVNAAVCFVMFTVSHDASHYAISRVRWVNALLGRLSFLFVSTALSFPSFAYVHIEHHRHANDDEHDPDTFASHGRGWQLPLRLAAMDVAYMPFYVRRLSSRPKGEITETGALLIFSVAGLAVAAVTGNLWLLLVIYVIPERIAVLVLAWWFDWLPHHGLEDTQRENRYGATRTRVGMEWLFTPLMLSQNYHLVHHLHPSIPFYRYVRTWKRNEEAYLEREAAISTVFGRDLNPTQYLEWKALNQDLLRLLPVRMPSGSAARHAVFHSIPVAAVDRLTADSTLITFAVPEKLAEQFRFEPGQHLTVMTDLGGRGVRRNYSICAPATRDTLQIAVKHIPGGAFSTFVATRLKAGDVLQLMTPTGSFGTALHPLNARHYVAIAAGSGITPILSILQTTLEMETESRITLIYGNRTRESTMFRRELDALEARYADRLEILHVLSRDPLHTAELQGRIDSAKLEHWLSSDLRTDTVDEWFLCGPADLTTTVRDLLIAHGANGDQIHLELFFGYGAFTGGPPANADPSMVTFRLSGREETFELGAGESVLEGALQRRPDTPYACLGGACGTCRARVLDGAVAMDQNFALGAADLDAGYVLTCQSHPITPAVTVDYDA